MGLLPLGVVIGLVEAMGVRLYEALPLLTPLEFLISCLNLNIMKETVIFIKTV